VSTVALAGQISSEQTWTWKPLGEVVELVRKPRGLSPQAEIPFITMAHISERSFDVRDWDMRPGSDARSGTYFETDDVLLARITPCFENGKLAIAPAVPAGWGMATTEVYPLRPGELEPRFLAYFLKTDVARAPLLRSMEGATGRMRVAREALEDLMVPVPPRPEQEWVVELIDRSFASIDVGDAEVNAAAEQLAQFETGVLDELLNSGHPRARLSEVSDVFVGATPSRKDPSLWGGPIPWVSSGEVAFCRIAETRETITDQAVGNPAKRLHPPGTVLFAMYGDGKTRGQAAILDIAAATNQAVAAIRVHPERLLPEFLYYRLVQNYDAVRRLAWGGQQLNLSKGAVEQIELPLPSLETQRALVSRIERIIDGGISPVRRDLASLRDESRSLRRRLLHAAFHGELVTRGMGTA
jgi:type I restriction enzyme S subunit